MLFVLPLNMVKKPTGISIDENLIGPVNKDLGRASFSAHVNYILEILYSPDSILPRQLEAIRMSEGLRDIPETMNLILLKYVPIELKERHIK